MRVPYDTQQQTRPPAQPLVYKVAPTPDLSPIAEGLYRLGHGLEIRGAAAREQTDQMDRFKAEEGYLSFEEDAKNRADQTIKDSPLNDKNLPDRALASYDTYASDFVSKLPPDQQEAAKIKVAELRQRVDAATRKAQDDNNLVYFNNSITDAQTKAQVGVEDNPDTYASNMKKLGDLVNASDLPQAVKDEWHRKNDQKLGSIVYRKQVEGNIQSGMAAEDARGKQLQFVQHELTGSESAAGGKLKAATTLEQAVEAGIAYERPQQTPLAIAFANRLNNARAVLAGTATPEAQQAFEYFKSVGYTPVQAAGFTGSLMQESGQHLNPSAANPNDPGTSVGIGQWNRERKAALAAFTGEDYSKLKGQTNVDDNPIFNSIPYEDRVALRKDAATNVNAMITQAHTQRVAQEAAFTNDAAMGIMTNKPGYDRAYVENAQQNGNITDADNYKKLIGLLDAKDANGLDARNFAAALSNGTALNTNDPGTQKGFNAWVGQGGLSSIQAKDQGYVNNTLMPAINKTGVIPTDVVGVADGMMRSSDPGAQLFAANMLSNMEHGAAAAYLKLDDGLRNRVDLWRAGRDSMDPEHLAAILRDNKTPEQRKAYQGLVEEAHKNLTDNSAPNYFSFNDEIVKRFAFGGILGGIGETVPQLPDIASAVTAMQTEGQALYADNYANLNGNHQAAMDLTFKELERTWGVSKVGGNIVLMKYPPEKAYEGQTVNGNYFWMSAQAREEMRLPVNAKVEFISDDVTRDDIVNHRPASYNVATINEYGAWTIPDPAHRQTFELTPKLKAQDDLAKNYKNNVAHLQELNAQIEAGQNLSAQATPDALQMLPVPQDLIDQRDELQKKVDEQQKLLNPEKPGTGLNTPGNVYPEPDPTPLDLSHSPEKDSFSDIRVDPKTVDQSQWEKRADGTPKSTGFLGLLKRPDGSVSSEISVQLDDVIGGKEFPILVPSLTRPEVDKVLALSPYDPQFFQKLPKEVQRKAIEHARIRVRAGKSPFASPEESPK